jgi:hypothetical protein
MNRISLATVFFIGIGPFSMFAQAPANSSGDQSVDSAVQQSSSHAEEVMQGGNSGDQFTGLLNGSGLISMDSADGLIFSAVVGGGMGQQSPSNPGESGIVVKFEV